MLDHCVCVLEHYVSTSMRKYIDLISLTQTDNCKALGNPCSAFETFCIVKKYGWLAGISQSL